jgi:hypothetical protein
MTPVGLTRKIARLPEAGAITFRFERELFRRGLWNYERERKKYLSQKMHWIGWLSDYGTAGYYNRKNKRVRSAEVIYKRIGCPPMLLWLCEASKVPARELRLAMNAALAVGPNYRRQCAEIRKIIPWPIVESKLCKATKPQPRARSSGRPAAH